MFKIRAMDDRIARAKLEPREQDVVDVVSILKAFDIDDFDRVDNEVIKSTIPYFPSKGKKECFLRHHNSKIVM